MITIQKEDNENVGIKISKDTKNLELLLGSVFLVEALKKELNTDTDTILNDIKKIIEADATETDVEVGEHNE